MHRLLPALLCFACVGRYGLETRPGDSADGDADVNSGDVDASSGDTASSLDVPAIAYCMDVANWDPLWAQLELEVVAGVNVHRSAGTDCPGSPRIPVPALTTSPALRCAARVHALDMQTQDYFTFTSPQGETVPQRIAAAGYSVSAWGTNLDRVRQTAAEVVAIWMGSFTTCSIMMDAQYVDVGVGYAVGTPYWVIVVTAPL